MKNLANRSLTTDQRDEVYAIAGGEDGEYNFYSLKYALNLMLKTLSETNGKPAYSSKDAMFQSISDRQYSYKRTGRY